MKIKRIFANNRQKVFKIQTAKGSYDFPFAKLSIKPSSLDRVKAVYADPELGSEGFTYVLESGREDTVHLDVVLEYNKDPEYICAEILHQLTVTALEALKQTGISKRCLARRLKTSPKQLHRLLDPTFYGKTINQMVKLLHVLGRQVRVTAIRKAA